MFRRFVDETFAELHLYGSPTPVMKVDDGELDGFEPESWTIPNLRV